MPSKLYTTAAATIYTALYSSIIKYFMFIGCLLSSMLFVRGFEGLTTHLRGKEMQGNIDSC